MEDAGFGKKSGPGSATGGLVSQQAFNDARPLFSPSPSPQAPPFPGGSPLRSPRFLSSELRSASSLSFLDFRSGILNGMIVYALW